jgi:hypothetical protein
LPLLPLASLVIRLLAIDGLADANAGTCSHAERVDDARSDDVVRSARASAELTFDDNGEVDVCADMEVDRKVAAKPE